MQDQFKISVLKISLDYMNYLQLLNFHIHIIEGEYMIVYSCGEHLTIPSLEKLHLLEILMTPIESCSFVIGDFLIRYFNYDS